MADFLQAPMADSTPPPMADHTKDRQLIIDNLKAAWGAQGMLPKTEEFGVEVETLPNGKFKAYALVGSSRHILAESMELVSYGYAIANLRTFVIRAVEANTVFHRLGSLGPPPGQQFKNPWTKAEEEALLQLRHEKTSRADIAVILDPRTAGAVESRYHAIRPENASRECVRAGPGPWTNQENAMLIKLYRTHGGRWLDVSSQSGYTRNACQARFNWLVRKGDKALFTTTAA